MLEQISAPALVLVMQKMDKWPLAYGVAMLLVALGVQHRKTLLECWLHLSMRNKPRVTLTGTIVQDRLGSRRNFSKRLTSLLHCVADSARSGGADCMAEVYADDPFEASEGDDRGINVMVVNQRRPLRLSKKVTCQVRVTDDTSVCNTAFSAERTRERTVKVRATLYHDTPGGMPLLLDFLADCETRFDRHNLDKLQQQLYFITLRSVVDGRATFVRRPFDTTKSFDNLFFPQKQDLIARLDTFMHCRSLYASFGVPHTLGLLFSGRPGCGKTACAKSIAAYTRRHVIVIPLHKVTKMSVLTDLFFDEHIDSVRVPFDTRLYVFEEIDCNGWEEVTASRAGEISAAPVDWTKVTDSRLLQLLKKDDDRVTLGGLLELLDGMAETPGRMMIVTTNFPERLDSALLRPGRIDMHVHFRGPTADDVAGMVRRWYGTELAPEEAHRVARAGLTHAELCCLFMRCPDDVDSALSRLDRQK